MYERQNYDNLLGTEGFSDDLLQNHFKLYQGYVKNTNKALELMQKHAPDSYEYGEIKRRFGWEFSGMRLHEYYFSNMAKGGKEPDKDSDFAKKIDEDFGSWEDWKNDFLATGGMRGIGWVVLYHDPIGKKLINTWINEHDLGHLTGCQPLLVMDVFEHAFMLDYGLNKGAYIQAFWNAIDWEAVANRYKA